MAANYLHGVETTEIDDGAVSISLVKTAIIGLVGTAPIFECGAEYQTVNEPVLILNDTSGAKYFGTVRDGYSIPQALDAIRDQQANSSGYGAVVVINVFDPTVHKTAVPEAAATFDSDGVITLGQYGLSGVTVKSSDGVTTYASGVDYTLDAVKGTITRIATGAIVGNTVKVAYTHADPSKVTAADIIGAVNAAGNRTGMQAWKNCFSLFGYWPKILIAPGFSPLAAVTAELIVLAESMRAITMVDAPVGTTFQHVLAGRGPSGAIAFNTSSPRCVLCYPHCKVYDTDTDTTELQPYSPRLAGVLAAKDMDKGYWWSPSNTEIQGITGMEILLTAGINDPNSECNQLNEVGITTIFNAYASGLRSWGNRSAAWPTVTGPKQFVNIRRVADVIAESIEYSMLQFLDRPINNAFIDAITESVNAFMRTLIARGAIIDGRCWYDKSLNEATELAAGHIVFSYDFMPPPPAERITFESRVNINYLSELNATANTTSAS
jgi:uncharacterized protein